MRSTCLVEAFESRRHLSSATATFSAGVLKVYGTTADDELTVSLSNSQVVVTWLDKTGSTPQTRTIKSVARSGVQSIRLFGSEGNDKLRVLVDIPAVVRGDLGNDTIDTAGSADTIYGGQGNDVITSAAGNDVIYGGAGNDGIRAGNGNDKINGNGNNDTLYGNFGNDTLYGGLGNDELRGGLGNDVINTGQMGGITDNDAPGAAGGFHDLIRGGQGNDIILANRADTVYGCAGRDTFRRASYAWPTISDFSGQDDTRSKLPPLMPRPGETILPIRPWQSSAMAVLFRMPRRF